MESFAFLQTIIGKGRTLVITCVECCLDIEQRNPGRVFRYTTLGNIVNPADTLQYANIERFIKFKNCSQIVVVGHTYCKALDFILHADSSQPYLLNSQARLQNILNNNHSILLNPQAQRKMLIDLNVIEQCRNLMQYECIRERLQQGNLSVVGLVITKAGKNKEVFRNGIVFNDFVSVN